MEASRHYKRINMIEVTNQAISPEAVITKAKSNDSGCLVIYVGLIRDRSHGKPVLSVEYQDSQGDAATRLQEIAGEARRKWQVENIAISHRTGKLMVGEINLVVTVASAHRREGFAACRYIIDLFKRKLPTSKVETYLDGSVPIKKTH
jgi:molybdopterin synthase catalytic subunit